MACVLPTLLLIKYMRIFIYSRLVNKDLTTNWIVYQMNFCFAFLFSAGKNFLTTFTRLFSPVVFQAIFVTFFEQEPRFSIVFVKLIDEKNKNYLHFKRGVAHVWRWVKSEKCIEAYFQSQIFPLFSSVSSCNYSIFLSGFLFQSNTTSWTFWSVCCTWQKCIAELFMSLLIRLMISNN